MPLPCLPFTKGALLLTHYSLMSLVRISFDPWFLCAGPVSSLSTTKGASLGLVFHPPTPLEALALHLLPEAEQRLEGDGVRLRC